MAVIDVIKMWSRTDGSEELQKPSTRMVRFREGYTVAHDAGTLKQEILDAAGLPKIGSTFENLPWVFAIRRPIVQSFLTLTVVDIEYEGEVGPGGLDSSPIDDPPEIEWSNLNSTEPVDTDGEGLPITTTLGEPVEGITTEIDDLVLRVKRNFLSVNLPATHNYLRSTNSDVYLGFAIGLAHLDGFRAKPIIAPDGNVKYYEVDATVIFRVPQNPDVPASLVWWHRYLNQGWRFKTADGRIINAHEDNQANINRPVLLQEDGTLVTDPDDKDQVHWVERPQFPFVLPYSALGLV